MSKPVITASAINAAKKLIKRYLADEDLADFEYKIMHDVADDHNKWLPDVVDHVWYKWALAKWIQEKG